MPAGASGAFSQAAKDAIWCREAHEPSHYILYVDDSSAPYWQVLLLPVSAYWVCLLESCASGCACPISIVLKLLNQLQLNDSSG